MARRDLYRMRGHCMLTAKNDTDGRVWRTLDTLSEKDQFSYE